MNDIEKNSISVLMNRLQNLLFILQSRISKSSIDYSIRSIKSFCKCRIKEKKLNFKSELGMVIKEIEKSSLESISEVEGFYSRLFQLKYKDKKRVGKADLIWARRFQRNENEEENY
jgi:hypothetical protein